MNFEQLSIKDVYLISPKIFNDERGYFYESFNKNIFNKAVNRKVDFVQDNHSQSKKGVIRGLHYQVKPYEQGKLVRVIKGKIFDVAVDLRKNSKTYGSWVSAILSSRNKRQIWIPEGFAHGFMALSDKVEVIYKTTNIYSKFHERSIHWKNNDFCINWPKIDSKIITSTKDS